MSFLLNSRFETFEHQSGCGPVEEVRPGDVRPGSPANPGVPRQRGFRWLGWESGFGLLRVEVWFSPGEKHWHGATPSTVMTHIAIQESLNGKVVDWMEHVTEQEYGK